MSQSPDEEAVPADTVSAASSEGSLTPPDFEVIARNIGCHMFECRFTPLVDGVQRHYSSCELVTGAISSALSTAFEEGKRVERERCARWRNDCGILLAQIDFLTEATGESFDCQDAGLIEQIRSDYRASAIRKEQTDDC